jgi:hypothetical protein
MEPGPLGETHLREPAGLPAGPESEPDGAAQPLERRGQRTGRPGGAHHAPETKRVRLAGQSLARPAPATVEPAAPVIRKSEAADVNGRPGRATQGRPD